MLSKSTNVRHRKKMAIVFNVQTRKVNDLNPTTLVDQYSNAQMQEKLLLDVSAL